MNTVRMKQKKGRQSLSWCKERTGWQR